MDTGRAISIQGRLGKTLQEGTSEPHLCRCLHVKQLLFKQERFSHLLEALDTSWRLERELEVVLEGQ
jgi:hypothetical protein